MKIEKNNFSTELYNLKGHTSSNFVEAFEMGLTIEGIDYNLENIVYGNKETVILRADILCQSTKFC